ncbi:MAG TPA: HAD hydrolase-like protein [Candidatus Limnocylindria bacterium]|nr:HAD hydrolase-like protein [Candidatus Limnocylindria bacterium]
MRLVHGRLAAVSVRASAVAGAWVGVSIGFVAGALGGAVLAWAAGTILAWQRDLAFTLGVARTLLPLGDQVGALRWLSTAWYLVIPATAVAVAILAALVGGLIGGLLAAIYNRSPRHASVVVELPDEMGIVGRMPPPVPAAIIFDLDGTLVDTVGARIAAWKATFDELGIPATRDQLRPMIGMDGVRLALDVADAAGRPVDRATAEDIDRRAGEAFDEHNRDPRPLPGAREALTHLNRSGLTWAIATSSRPEQVRASIASLGLDVEPRIIDGGSVEHAKPAPDLLLLAARELGVEPTAAWYVGDSTWDMRAAVAAEMRPIAVLAGAAVNRAALEDAGAETILDTLDELEIPA